MRFLSWLLFAHFWYLTDCSLNESRSEEQDTSARRATGLALHGTTSPRDGPRRPILRLRQFPGSVQTVTATVTLTVTNTVFSTLPSTPTSDSPQPTNPPSCLRHYHPSGLGLTLLCPIFSHTHFSRTHLTPRPFHTIAKLPVISLVHDTPYKRS